MTVNGVQPYTHQGLVITAGLAEQAHRVHQTLLGHHRAKEQHKQMLGLYFAQVLQQRLYLALGYDSWEEYLAQPELGYSRQTAWRYMKTAGALVQLTQAPHGEAPIASPAQITAIGTTKMGLVDRALRHAASDDERREWIARAATLATGDLQQAVEETYGKTLSQREEVLRYFTRSFLDLARTVELADDPGPVIRAMRQKCDDALAVLTALEEGSHVPG